VRLHKQKENTERKRERENEREITEKEIEYSKEDIKTLMRIIFMSPVNPQHRLLHQTVDICGSIISDGVPSFTSVHTTALYLFVLVMTRNG